MNDKTKELETLPIGKLLAQYSIPAVIAMVVNAIYNVVDRIFIGNFAGEKALAGLTIAFPIMMIIFAFASLIGIGGASLMSINLGKKDIKQTSKIFSNMLSLGTIITILILILLKANLDSLLVLFGATADTIQYASSYLTIIIYGFIFQMISFILNSSVRTENQPILSMVSMLISAVTNIILDYIFIAIFNMGVEGAAIATISGQFVGLLFLLSFYIRKKSVLQLKPKYFIPNWKIFTSIISIGITTFLTTLGTSIAMSFMNRGLGKYGGTAAITAMGAINSIFTLFIMPIMGVQQGMQPIIGYNHGAKRLDRAYKTLKLGLIIGIAFSTVMFLLLEIFPKAFISMFIDSNSDTVNIAVTGLRIYMLSLPLLSINIYVVGFYQSIAKSVQALLLGIIRQFVFLIPLIIIFQNAFGLMGIWFSVPVADGIAIIISIISLIVNYRNTKNTIKIHKESELRLET
ncbi:MAG: MATE family efflux transporter [Sphaerochaetaceae bacterium]